MDSAYILLKKYVKLLGADCINVESEEGKGSRFFFTLSFKLCSEKDATHIVPKQEQRSQQVIQSTPRIMSKSSRPIDDSLPDNAPFLLLIEDNKPALIGLESMVKKSGM
jgi:hypothetical protein